jgi:CheY-like chemotaxis protein
MPSPIEQSTADDDAPQSNLSPTPPAPLARLVAHAINNPLAALFMDLDAAEELLEDGAEGVEAGKRIEEARVLLGGIRESAIRIRKVVEDMRDTPTTADAVRALSATPAIARGSAPAPKAVKARVLVIDDDSLVANAVKRTLREHEVVVQISAAEALAQLQAGERFDIVLCDLMMPEVTGMDMYEALLRIDPEQAERMIFVTGGAVTTRAREFVAATRNAVVEKPFDVRKLREVIARSQKPPTGA